jgi:hypothetical protein
VQLRWRYLWLRQHLYPSRPARCMDDAVDETELSNREDTMRTALTTLALVCVPALALAGQVHVDGYTKRDGTYVAPHVRSSPDRTTGNNYGAPGNYNPNTGRITPQPSYGTAYGRGSQNGKSNRGVLGGYDGE